MNPTYKGRILVVTRIILGVVFLASGIGKLINSTDARFLVELMATEIYWLIEYADMIVWAISAVELVVAVLLLWGRYLTVSLTTALLMLIGFTGVLGFFYLQGMNVENCGCFGAFGFATGLELTFLRNFVLMGMIAGVFYLSREKEDRFRFNR